MDLGIKGKRAIVCAGSKGLGRGCAMALAQAGVDIILNARGAEALEKTAAEIAAATGVTVIPVAADISTVDGRARVLDAAGQVDILVNNAGGPPPGMWNEWDRDDFIRALDANMLAPIAMMQAVLPSMIDRGWGRVVNITSAAVRSPIGVLGLSNTARMGLTGFVAGTSRQVANKGVVINNLLPGLHATDRSVLLDTAASKAQGISLDEAVALRAATIPAGRYGTAEEFGATCAFMCSQFAGFMVGQSVMLDGGAANISI